MMAAILFFLAYYLLKSLYFMRYRATFNEVTFVVILPHVPLLFAFFSSIFDVTIDPITSVSVKGAISLSLYSDFIDLVSLPLYIFSLFVLMRTFLRYPFIRLYGHSTNGFPSRVVGLALTLEVPFVYAFAVFAFLPNLSLLMFSITFLLIGFLSMFV